MTKVCTRCGKGSRHFTEWDDPSGYKDGSGTCQSYYRYGGCVGEWTCLKQQEVIVSEAQPITQVKPTGKAALEREILKLQDELASKIKQLAEL